MDREPFVSAVVEVVPEPAVQDAGLPVEEPGGVAMQAAAMLGGADMDPGVGSGPTAPAGTSPSGSRNADADANASAMAKTKGYFTRAGFEVHAPVGMSFSIAASQSAFEEFFGEQLSVDEERLGGPVTTAGGGQDLPLGKLPDEIRGLVRRIFFLPPPDIPTLT